MLSYFQVLCQQKYFVLYWMLLLLGTSCQPTKYLSDEQLLYTGATLTVGEPEGKQPRPKLRKELLAKVRQQSNSKVFGARFRLWVYQRMRNNQKEKGIAHWLKTKLGEPPVIYNEGMTEQSRLLMEKNLRDNGFLNGTVRLDTTVHRQKVSVHYQVDGQGLFVIRNYILPPDSTLLLKLVTAKIRKPIIRPGTPYRVANIDAERLRLKDLAQKNGFFEFDESSIYFYLDTTVVGSQFMDVYLSIKPPADGPNYQPHILGGVTLFPDYTIQQDTVGKDTIREDFWTMIQSRDVVKLKALQEVITQDSGSIYSRPQETQVINYLLDLGVFKFVNLRYVKDSIDGQAVLQRYFYLTPSVNQDVGIDVEASTETSYYIGSAVGVNYTHRNVFRGAEQLKTGFSFGVESQAGNIGPFINTVEANANVGLRIPRLWLPFKKERKVKGAIPKTLINLVGTFQRRNTLFTSASLLTELGYSWKENRYFQHQFYPFRFTLLRLFDQSEAFNQILLANPRLRASFDNISILSANYQFTYSTQELNVRNNYFFLKCDVESAGNLANLLARIGSKNNDSYQLLGSPIAQFAKVAGELHYTWYGSKTALVGRLSGGLAFPYGNSDAVPYIRQFFVGGASSIRAFSFRGVGPGSYSPSQNADSINLVFFDRVGDVKLEANAEYRFPLFSYLKGAFFVDAGNVWLLRKSAEELPEGKFEWNRFYKEMAIGTGFGLRLDIQFVVIRFDIGIPVRDPSFPDGAARWVIQDFKLGSKTWRKENLKYNLAIGYPF